MSTQPVSDRVPEDGQASTSEIVAANVRAEAARRGIPMTTTIRGLRAAVDGLKTLRKHAEFEVLSLQEYNRATARKKGARSA